MELGHCTISNVGVLIRLEGEGGARGEREREKQADKQRQRKEGVRKKGRKCKHAIIQKVIARKVFIVYKVFSMFICTCSLPEHMCITCLPDAHRGHGRILELELKPGVSSRVGVGH